MVIIDTHVLIWMLYERDRLSPGALRALSSNDVCVSIVSLWEMSIKKAKGMIDFDHTIPQIADKCREMGVDILRVTPEHCQRIQTLPLYHKDPFDRMIVAQAAVEGMTLVTRDEKIWNGYPNVDKLW